MDTLEIIRQIEADPALAAQLRAVLLGDQRLHKIEDRLDKLVEVSERHEETLARLVEVSERHEETLVRHEETLARLVEVSERHEETLVRLVEVSERHEETLVRHEETLARLVEVSERHEETLVRHGNDLAELRGSDYERRMRDDPGLYLGEHIQRIHQIRGDDLDAFLDNLQDRNGLTSEDRRRIRRTDFVAEARTVSANEKVTVVGEISATVHANDIERVALSAQILEGCGLRLFAFASGKDLGGSRIEQMANEKHVTLIDMS